MRALPRTLIAALLIAILCFFLTEQTLGSARAVVGAIIYPISRPVTGLSQSIHSIVATVKNIGNLRNDNQTLSDKNQALTAQVAQLEALKHENDELKQALAFAQSHQDEKLIAAQVIGRSPTQFLQSVVVDKGSSDGVKSNSPVISDGFLVGQVSELTPHRATVRLITSSDSLIAVRFAKSQAQGLLKGGLEGLAVTQVPLDAKVDVDEPAVTSAIGGIVPENIPVGTAKSQNSISSSILQNIRLDSPIDFTQLDLLFIGQPSGAN